MIRLIQVDEMYLTEHVARAFFDESGIAGELNFNHFASTWGNLIKLGLASIMLYFDKDGKVNGIIGGTNTECTMTGDKVAMECFWWTAKHLRGTTIGLNLLRKWETWCKDNGAVRIYIGNLVELNDKTMQGIYARLGYKPTEVHYIKSLL